MMKIELRDYVCPTCGNKTKHSTNHEGEIYSGCKVCGGSVLHFAGSNRKFKPMFKINFYEFDVSTIEEDTKYRSFCRKIENELNVKCHASLLSPRQSKTFWESLKSSETISVHEPETFDDQFITDKGRLHRWYEAVYPNKRIKRGYYLTLDQRFM